MINNCKCTHVEHRWNPFLCLMDTFSALLYMYYLHKCLCSGFYFIYRFPAWRHSWPTFLYATPDLLYRAQSEKSTWSYCKYFVLPLPACLSSPPPNLLPLFPSPAPTLSFCLNLLSLMSPSRESQARKKGRGLTEIDVWALPLIRWLNPSINMQRRCPMQMDPIRRNGGVLSVRCGEW